MKFESVMMKTSDGTEEEIGVLVPEILEKIEVPVLTEHQVAQIQLEMGEGFDRTSFQSPNWIGYTIGKICQISIKPKCDNKIVSKVISHLKDDGWIQDGTTKGDNGNSKPSYVVGKKAKPVGSSNFDQSPLD